MNLDDIGNVYVDDLNNKAMLEYSSSPERLYIVNSEKKVVMVGGEGPFLYKLSDVTEFLEKYVWNFW